MPSSPQVDIIIPSYNGRLLLEKNLPFVIKNTESLNKIIVVDNGSTDDTIAWLSANYPQVLVHSNKSNLGFTIPVNQGVSLSRSEYFVLLNNDVVPHFQYLSNPLKVIKKENIFAVSFNETQSSWPKMLWDKGKVQFSHGSDKNKLIYTPWASGGSALFKRQIWDTLGGFDEIYSPWYWEDIDIGYRAWKSGFKILWDPSSKVEHKHESTSKKLNKNLVDTIKQRNELLFNWLNITDKNYVRGHLLFLLTHTFFHPGYLRIILTAIVRRLFSKTLTRKFIISDTTIMKQFSKVYEG